MFIKGPFINYVTHLGEGGGGSNCFRKCHKEGRGVTEVSYKTKVYILMTFYIVGCQGVVHLGGPCYWYNSHQV